MIVLKNRKNIYHGTDLKIGITVTKKHGNAVLRNHAKRKIKALCRELIPQMQKGNYIIIQPFSNFSKMDFNDLRKEAEVLFRKAGVISE